MSDITGFYAFSWEPLDLISLEAMNQLNSNVNALHNFMPRGAFTTDQGLFRREQVKMMSGRIIVPKTKKKIDEASVDVSFPQFFSQGCDPNVTIGINSRNQPNLFVTFRGKPGTGLLPDITGFQIDVLVAAEDGEKSHIARPFFVHWQAMGY
jgi:hypothetical protein